MGLLAGKGLEWVQFDEPVLVTDMLADVAGLAERTDGRLAGVAQRPAIFVAAYFGELSDAPPALAHTPVEAIGVDLVAGGSSAVAAVPGLAGKLLAAGVVDGRNVWRHRFRTCAGLARHAARIGWGRCSLDVVYVLHARRQAGSRCGAA